MQKVKQVAWKLTVIALFAAGIVLSPDTAAAQGQPPAQPAQQSLPPSKYQPTEVQMLRLQVRLKDAQLAQVALQRAQAQFQQALAALDTEAGNVRRENKWPDGVQFSPDTLRFDEAPKPAPGAQVMPSAPEKKP